MNSRSVFAGTEGFTSSTACSLASSEIGAKSSTGSWVSLEYSEALMALGLDASSSV